jgi:hypothetical protein
MFNGGLYLQEINMCALLENWQRLCETGKQKQLFDDKGDSMIERCPDREDTVKQVDGYVLRYNKQGRFLSEQDTLRVMALAIKHIGRKHLDWEELMVYVEKFDASCRG